MSSPDPTRDSTLSASDLVVPVYLDQSIVFDLLATMEEPGRGGTGGST
jgi:hypothetical protein